MTQKAKNKITENNNQIYFNQKQGNNNQLFSKKRIVGIIIYITIIVLLLSLFVYFFENIAEYFFIQDNESRGELIKVFLAFIAGIVGFLVWNTSYKRVKVMEEQTKRTDKQIEIMYKGNVDTRFNNAVGNLGKKSRTVVLGGIHALHQIAFENENYTQVVHNLFCSYLRENSLKFYENIDLNKTPDRCPVIIQTLINYLFRPYNGNDSVYRGYKSNLSSSTLINCDFNGINIENVFFDHCVLEKCDFQHGFFHKCSFIQSTFKNCNFGKSTLDESYMIEADLSECSFIDGNLSKCVFVNGDIKNCYFANSNLRKCSFLGAILSECNFMYSTLDECNFSETNFSECSFIDGTFSKCKMIKTKFNQCTLTWSYESFNFEKGKAFKVTDYTKIIDCEISGISPKNTTLPPNLEKYNKILSDSDILMKNMVDSLKYFNMPYNENKNAEISEVEFTPQLNRMFSGNPLLTDPTIPPSDELLGISLGDSYTIFNELSTKLINEMGFILK
ncbi:MAG: pentapeptide repeat-containing protein [Treponema sp.]|nr:pentapeptide repeat-containing protein [Treponema sp.]